MGFEELILNFFGGTIRWFFGSIYCLLLNKKKYTFWEYINGLKNSKDYYDQMGHASNNIIIAFIVMFIFCVIIYFFNL